MTSIDPDKVLLLVIRLNLAAIPPPEGDLGAGGSSQYRSR
jgi:hypothetical protein